MCRNWVTFCAKSDSMSQPRLFCHTNLQVVKTASGLTSPRRQFVPARCWASAGRQWHYMQPRLNASKAVAIQTKCNTSQTATCKHIKKGRLSMEVSELGDIRTTTECGVLSALSYERNLKRQCNLSNTTAIN